VEDCRRSVVENLPRQAGGALLDCGCAEGDLTLRSADWMGADVALGIEKQVALAERAGERGIRIVGTELNEPLPVEDGAVDAATANQVIEHLADTDNLVRELYRVVRPGGVLVLSTNNLASWHNLVALLVGAQPFPADVSRNSSLGKLVGLFPGDPGSYESWTHLRIYSYRALKEMMEFHGFSVERVQGVGYYPLPSRLANRLAAIDPRHAAYLTVRCRKPA
jgi:SAM-dependent methyltransferase